MSARALGSRIVSLKRSTCRFGSRHDPVADFGLIATAASCEILFAPVVQALDQLVAFGAGLNGLKILPRSPPYLVSPHESYVTGATLQVDGGLLRSLR